MIRKKGASTAYSAVLFFEIVFWYLRTITLSLRILSSHLSILNDGGLEALGVLDVDSLDVRVELLLGTLLVITLTADADTESEWDTLDTGFPDLLVQLGVEADVLGALFGRKRGLASA